MIGLDALRTEPFFAQSKARMAALLGHERPARILDVGCGTGEDAIALVGSAVGLERSTVMCAEARARHPNLALIAADAIALPISEGSVDAVRADRVLQHLPDAQGPEWVALVLLMGTLVLFGVAPGIAIGPVDTATVPLLLRLGGPP